MGVMGMYGILGTWTNRIRSIPDHTGLLGGAGGPGSTRGKTGKNKLLSLLSMNIRTASFVPKVGFIGVY